MKTLSDPEFKAKLQELRRTDNVTNWYYVLRAYLFLGLVIGGAVWFFENRPAPDVPWWVNIPVALDAVLLVGAGSTNSGVRAARECGARRERGAGGRRLPGPGGDRARGRTVARRFVIIA